MEDKEIFTKQEACKFLGISKSKLEALIRTGQIPYFRIPGRLVRFKKSSLLNWTAKLEEKTLKFDMYIKPKKKGGE